MNKHLTKSKLCEKWMSTNGNCPYGWRCKFAHGTMQLRKASCINMIKHGKCENTNCEFNHDVEVEQPQKPKNNDLWKTKLCFNYMKSGKCTYGNICQYAHGEQDLYFNHKKEEEIIINGDDLESLSDYEDEFTLEYTQPFEYEFGKMCLYEDDFVNKINNICSVDNFYI